MQKDKERIFKEKKNENKEAYLSKEREWKRLASENCETIDRIVAFLERPDISYCKPDRKETVYCGKDLNGVSVYKPKHYLLWTLHETLNQFNPDESFTLTYYT